MHGAASLSLMSRKGTVQWFGLTTFNFCLVARRYFGNSVGNSVGLLLSDDGIWSSWRLSLEFLSDLFERSLGQKHGKEAL